MYRTIYKTILAAALAAGALSGEEKTTATTRPNAFSVEWVKQLSEKTLPAIERAYNAPRVAQDYVARHKEASKRFKTAGRTTTLEANMGYLELEMTATDETLAGIIDDFKEIATGFHTYETCIQTPKATNSETNKYCTAKQHQANSIVDITASRAFTARRDLLIARAVLSGKGAQPLKFTDEQKETLLRIETERQQYLNARKAQDLAIELDALRTP